ncbi:MAG: hypothetical protein GY862_08910, partial [Gammaproteobacteria bacterium]|nr:hypothetical protein [Gammaproteobacteria bacterium]
DGDGVADHADKCPDNAEYQLSQGVNSDGCPPDSDGDGVADYKDKCPDSTELELSQGVDSGGCPKDIDSGGIPDYRDECPRVRPDDPAADADNCPPDSDEDAVADYADKCPDNTELELSRGVNFDGCPTDSDRDGIPDYQDRCPDTPYNPANRIHRVRCVWRANTPASPTHPARLINHKDVWRWNAEKNMWDVISKTVPSGE